MKNKRKGTCNILPMCLRKARHARVQRQINGTTNSGSKRVDLLFHFLYHQHADDYTQIAGVSLHKLCWNLIPKLRCYWRLEVRPLEDINNYLQLWQRRGSYICGFLTRYPHIVKFLLPFPGASRTTARLCQESTNPKLMPTADNYTQSLALQSKYI